MALTINEAADIITKLSPKDPVLLRGPMGCGKTSVGKLVVEQLNAAGENYELVYIDCASLNFGDLTVPAPDFQRKVVDFLVASHIDLKKDLVVVLDEYLKADRSIQNYLAPAYYDRRLGCKYFSEKTKFILTGNSEVEGLGDNLYPFIRDRFIELEVKKSSAREWVDSFAIKNNVSDEVIGFALKHEEIFCDFDENNTNKYIFDPNNPDRRFATLRGLEALDRIYKALKDNKNHLFTVIKGRLGDAVASAFNSYLITFGNVPSASQIIIDGNYHDFIQELKDLVDGGKKREAEYKSFLVGESIANNFGSLKGLGEEHIKRLFEFSSQMVGSRDFILSLFPRLGAKIVKQNPALQPAFAKTLIKVSRENKDFASLSTIYASSAS